MIFDSNEQDRILSSVSAFNRTNDVFGIKEALLVPEKPTSVRLVKPDNTSAVLDLNSQDEVRFVRQVLNSPALRDKVSFSPEKGRGIIRNPFAAAPEPTQW